MITARPLPRTVPDEPAADSWFVEASDRPGPYSLVRDFAGLGELLTSQLQNRRLIDVFLAAAGMNQILDDYLHRDLGQLKKSARHLRELGPARGRVGAALIAHLGGALERLYPTIRERDLIKRQPELAGLVQLLADEVAGVAPVGPPPSQRAGFATELSRVSAPLGRALVRLPACFTTFDQQPADIAHLAHDFSARWPDRRRPLVVMGVRTSGSYLAPLMAGFLKAQGFDRVQVVTWRSEQEWLPSERRRLVDGIRAGGLALVIDDPPTSGRTLAGAAAALETAGFSRASIVLAFAAFASPAWGSWPHRLAAYQRLILPWDQWEIQRHLAPRAVQRTLAGLLVGHRAEVFTLGRLTSIRVGAVGEVERIPFPATVEARLPASPRGHVRALCCAQLVEQGTGRIVDQEVLCRGTGLGYLGAASAAVAERLRDYLPPVYGAKDGLLYRAWLPEASRLDLARVTDPEGVIARITSYAATRAQTLRVPEELSRRLVTEDASWGETIWQGAAQLLSPAFGRAAPIARALLRGTFLRLLPVSRPSIIDGRTDAGQWFEAGDGRAGSLRKIGFDNGAYKAGTIRCYDPWFDVASAAIGEGSHLEEALRADHAAKCGEPIDEERWLIYRLLALENREAAREMSSLVNRYLGDLYLGDVTTAPDGPLCAIDIDGVLETSGLGFPSITPAGALALRALARHRYRAILVTGRSLDEVRDRCDAYRLAGGVAEYGAVIYNRETGAVRPLLKKADQAELNAMRSVLENLDDVQVDPTYRYAVRAYRIQSDRRRSLDPQTVQRALTQVDGVASLQSIVGQAQTDFVTARFNKGTGLRALATDLDSPTVAMAVGDTASDLPMFDLASRSFAPSNADPVVREAKSKMARLTILDRPHQPGLLKAVSMIVGHRPGSCPSCRRPVLSQSAGELISILAAQDLGRWLKLGHLLRLAARAR